MKTFLLEPRVLVSPQAISSRSLKMLDKSVASLKRGLASDDLAVMRQLTNEFDAKEWQW